MIPSIKTIRERLFQNRPCLSALTVRQVMEGTGLSNFESVRKLVADCHHSPSLEYKQMTALNEILEGYGDEPIWEEDHVLEPYATYVNMGDSYINTVIYETWERRFLVMSVGDFIEKRPKVKFG